MNDVLYSISTTPGVSIAVAGLLFAMAVVISCRASSKMRESSSMQRTEHRCFVMAFALIVLLAAVFCVLLDKHWVHWISFEEKIPLYCVVGVALQVVLTFSFLDILNAFLNLVCRSQKHDSSSSKKKRLRVVSSPSQICLVLVVTVAMGLVFGIVFGVYDVEDDSSQIRWHKDNETTFPMGMIGGGITGFSVYMCVVFNDVCTRSSHRKGTNDKFSTPRHKTGYSNMPVRMSSASRYL